MLSAVSFWEISVKYNLGKLPLPQPPSQFVPQQRERHFIASLALDEAAVAKLSGLPALHCDPFDLMLVCQTQAHGLTLASSDALIPQYAVTLLRPFHKFQTDARERAGLPHLFFFGYCNVSPDPWPSYMPDLESAARGGYGASDTTRAEVCAGERLLNQALAQLYTLQGRLKPKAVRHIRE